MFRSRENIKPDLKQINYGVILRIRADFCGDVKELYNSIN
jgi:hypothetical protein